MQTTREDVFAALRKVKHVESGQNLVDLDMVRDVHMVDGRVTVTLALSPLVRPLTDPLVNDVRVAIAGLPGVAGLDVNLTEMAEEERRHLPQGTVGPESDEWVSILDPWWG